MGTSLYSRTLSHILCTRLLLLGAIRSHADRAAGAISAMIIEQRVAVTEGQLPRPRRLYKLMGKAEVDLAHLVEAPKLVVGELDVQDAQIVPDLALSPRPYDGNHDAWPAKQPR